MEQVLSLKKDWWKNNNNSTKNLLLVKQSKFSKNHENEKKVCYNSS